MIHIQLSQSTTTFDPKHFFMSGRKLCTGQVCLLTFDLKRFLADRTYYYGIFPALDRFERNKTRNKQKQ